MKGFEVYLYKSYITRGKEDVANEWINFLNTNSAKGLETLKNEKVYLENYFLSEEDGQMVVYIYIAAEDIRKANETALSSENEIDLKHFAYMRECVEKGRSIRMDSVVCFNNLGDY